jgi:putative ABC transport system permease protein
VRVNGTLLRVVGVMEPGFRGAELPGSPLLWLPASAISILDPSAAPEARTDRMFRMWDRLIGRRAANATPAQIEAAANSIVAAVRTQYFKNSYLSKLLTFQVFPGVGLDPSVRQSARHTLMLLIGAAAFLLCLAIANLTNLALAHTVSRAGATAVRFALGATRWRIVRGLLVETLMLSACGGALAVVLAAAWGRWFSNVQLSEFGAALTGMHVDAGVVAFVVLVSVGAALVAFLQPAIAMRWRPLEILLRRAGHAGQGQRLQSTLVGFQVALSVVLLVSALLLGRTVLNLRHVNLGFSPEHIVTMQADPQLHGYDATRIDRLARALEDRLRGAPGIASVGVVSPKPLRSQYTTGWLWRRPAAAKEENNEGIVGPGFYVTPGFLHALGAQVLAGDQDWRADSGTVVITREMLRQLLPGVPPASALGRTVFGRKDVPLRIAAVIEDLKLSDLTKAPQPTQFLPMGTSRLDEPLSIYVRTSGNSALALDEVSRAMKSIASDVPLYDVRTARSAVDLQFAEQEVMAIVVSILGALGVALAAIGLYGVLANVVAARQREIAIRAALGAGPTRIMMRVFARGFIPVAVGAVIGTVGAVAATKLFASKLFGLEALDPRSYAWGVIAIGIVALLACAPPAYRATRVSIVRMLRAE